MNLNSTVDLTDIYRTFTYIYIYRTFTYICKNMKLAPYLSLYTKMNSGWIPEIMKVLE